MPRFSFLLILLSVFLTLHVACGPHYHAVRLSKGIDQEGNAVNYYAVTRNGMIIPEYVIDERGDYPISEEEAWQRFSQRKGDLENLVKTKYILPNNTAYEMKRNTIGAGLLVVSPVLLPMQMLSNSMQEKKSGVQLSNRNYFEMAFEEPVPKDPKLKDPINQ